MNHTPDQLPQDRRKTASAESVRLTAEPSVRRLDDDPRRVFASFVGHLARVVRPPANPAPPRKSPRRKAGAP
jgi:hypothetical protein